MTALPNPLLSKALFEWTRGARNRLLRLANLNRRSQLLELGCGWGYVAEELAERLPSAHVVAIDRETTAIEQLAARSPRNLTAVAGDVHQLPAGIGRFDLIVSHFAFLWFRDPARVVSECRRVLRENGVILAIEPDYGGLMEYPDTGRREQWIRELSVHEADPFIGRKLPALFKEQELQVQVLFCDRYLPADPVADQFFYELTGRGGDSDIDPSATTIFLPLWLVVGRRGDGRTVAGSR